MIVKYCITLSISIKKSVFSATRFIIYKIKGAENELSNS
uniref:Uncharacterized protein n=1 Tax=Arundo donax TaxID=35708 RepID=A0A0A9LYA1_ARUDO